MRLSSLLATVALGAPAFAQSVQISEFLAVNDSGLQDFQGSFSDWIELHNTTGGSINLGGWHLTDDPLQPAKWTFPSTVVPAGGRLVVFASGLDVTTPQLHTSFALASGGEYLALVHANGTTIDAYAPEFPDQFEDVSYGRGVDLLGAPATGHFTTPTPGTPNGVVAAPVDPVEYSVERGFYDGPFSLALTCDTPNVLVRYTLDGSEPDPTKQLYTAPIPIATTSIVRAAAYLVSTQSITTSTTSTYVFPAHVLNQTHAGAIAAGFPPDWITKDGINWALGGTFPGAWYGFDSAITSMYPPAELVESLKSMPSMSLVMSVDDWFGYNPPSGPFGIYPNSQSSGPQWDRAVSLEYLDPDGGPQFQINCGIGIQGGTSINPDQRSQLSLGLKFKSEFGPTELEFPLFEDSLNDDFDYLLLDGGNQGSISSHVSIPHKKHAQGTRDQYMADLQRTAGGETFHGTFVHVYVNGLYWGVYNLHEKPDERWASETYGGADEEYDHIKEGAVLFGNDNPVTHPTAPGAWAILGAITATGLGDAAVYGGQPAYALFQEWCNLSNYVDYMCLNFFGGNTDWPQRNWMATSHSRLSADFTDLNPDQEWLWHSWDAETTLGWEGVTAVGDGFYDRTGVIGFDGSNVAYFYTQLQNHSEFALAFADRAHRLLFNDGALYVDPAFATVGTVYDPAHPERNRPAALYHDLTERIEGGIPMEYARWANYFHAPGTVTPVDWENERKRILNDYFPIRSGVLLAQLKNKALYPNVVAPSFNQHGGQVPLGFALTMSAPVGTIHYTLDGSDPRQPGGGVSPAATAYTSPVPLLAQATVKARVRTGGQWSALNEATFVVGLTLRINEILADNASVAVDEAGQHEDYVEIHNSSGASVDLSGMYLSDVQAFPTKWQVPAGTVVPAGGTVLVWCDEDAGDGPLHASFKLSKDGEEVGLYHTDLAGNLEVDRVTFGPQTTDVSIGRIGDGGATLYALLDPSPGAPNLPAQGGTTRYDATPPAAWNPASLTPSGVAGLGQALTLSWSGAPASIGVRVIGLQPLALPYSPTSVGLLLPVLPAAWSAFVTDGLGSATTPMPIPPSAPLVGAVVYVQGLVGPHLSNAFALRIGP